MSLYVICYEPTSGSLPPNEFTKLLNEIWPVKRIFAATWIIRHGYDTAGQVRKEIEDRLFDAGDSLAAQRYLFIAKVDEEIGLFRTYVDEWELLISGCLGALLALGHFQDARGSEPPIVGADGCAFIARHHTQNLLGFPHLRRADGQPT